MFVCIECGRVFEVPNKWTEHHGLDTEPYEHWFGCPTCGGAYTEAYECNCCGEWITDNYIKTDNGARYCSNCIRHMELGDEE